MMAPTPTKNSLPTRSADFSNLAEALDYAAKGTTGYNFYNGKGKLYASLPYKDLQSKARKLARHLLGLDLPRGSRVAQVAETHPDFIKIFFACQYAGLVPVPLPISIHLGGHQAYVEQLKRLLEDCLADIAVAPEVYLPLLEEAAADLDLSFCGSPASIAGLPQRDKDLNPSGPKELAYLQYTSGSTRFPRGVMITQETVMNNLSAMIKHGIRAQHGDRSVSWLPFYHDMGLVGQVLAPMASQISVDYLSPRDFAMRPRLWLRLISDNRATVSFGPPVGYELSLQRLRASDLNQLDLNSWRVAGVGAEPIRMEPLARFARALAPTGFNKDAFVAGYGMAECSLAVSFSPLGRGMMRDSVDQQQLSEFRKAVPQNPLDKKTAKKVKGFINCGDPLPGFDVEVRDDSGRLLSDRQIGTLFVRGPSVMNGYFGHPHATREVLSSDGWLNTGDLAYRVGKSIYITGRKKDMIIVNGRNVWPQDLEYLAESQPEVRTGDASAFAAPDEQGRERAVLVVQCRGSDEARRAALIKRVQGLIRRELAIDCFIELVSPHTLPRTTSGKLSRSKARKDFLVRMAGNRQETRLRKRAI